MSISTIKFVEYFWNATGLIGVIISVSGVFINNIHLMSLGIGVSSGWILAEVFGMNNMINEHQEDKQK